MAGSAALVINCSDLDAFRVFGDYADTLKNRTSFNETLLRQCQKPICQALWGFGVPDISGVGVAIGYVLSIFISTALCLLIALRYRSRQVVSNSTPNPQKPPPSKSVLVSGLSSYFESAVYFSLAIQLATIAILAPKDLETAASSIGYYEIRIAGLVSTISLLPLPAPVVILALYDHAQDDDEKNAEPDLQPEHPQRTNPPRYHDRVTRMEPKVKKKKQENRNTYRIAILVITVLASVYTFLSQSIRYWSPSTLGDHKGDAGATYITDQEWSVLWDVCFGELDGTFLSEKEHVTLGAFHMLASIAVLLFTIGSLISVLSRRDSESGLVKSEAEDEVGTELKGLAGKMKRRLKLSARKAENMVVKTLKQNKWVRVSLVVVAFCLTAPLLWGFFRLRNIQTRLALAVGGTYEGNDWGFGQVMAIAVFAPVGAEMLFVGLRKRYGDNDEEPEQQEQGKNPEQKATEGDNTDSHVGESTTEIQGRERIKTWPW